MVITPADLPPFERLFEEYYRGKIAALPTEAERRAARRMIEDELVKADPATGIAYRMSADGRRLRALPGMSEALLKRLTDDFLLRSEPNTTGDFNYEVSHDTLVEGILKSKTEYEAELAQAAAEQQAREEAERLRREAEEQRKEKEKALAERRRARLVALGAIILSLFAIGASWYAYQQSQQASAAAALVLEKEKQVEANVKIAQDKTLLADTMRQKATEALRRADEKEAEAKRNLLEVQRQKNATAEQTRRAEQALRQAQDERAKAEYATGGIVTNLLDNATASIKRLDYEDAWLTATEAADLVVDRPAGSPLAVYKLETAYVLAEPAYFYAQTGAHHEAKRLLLLIGRLTGKDLPDLAAITTDGQPGNRALLDKTLENILPVTYNLLRTRYYPDMAPLKGGKFNMGSEDGGEDEKPVHEVELSDFQLARTETTVWQYNLCLAATGRNMLDKKVKSKPGWGWEGDNPIVNVSWYDAVVYANWLSRQWGRTPAYTIDSVGRTQSDWKIELADQADGFRLPTEAEWEYAARGGSQQYAYRYAGGDSLELVARFRENSSNRAQPVTSRLPVKPDPDNPQTWLYDMSGNVYEWCGDWYDEGYYQKLRDVPEKNPKGPPDGSSRVLRGGSWDDRSSNFCRVASRGNYVPRSRYVIFGFRLAQDK